MRRPDMKEQINKFLGSLGKRQIEFLLRSCTIMDVVTNGKGIGLSAKASEAMADAIATKQANAGVKFFEYADVNGKPTMYTKVTVRLVVYHFLDHGTV